MTRHQKRQQIGSSWITKKKRYAIYKRDNYRCAYCGEVFLADKLTLDHLQPHELGGNNCHTNLVTACLSCNSAKGAKNMRQFFAWLRNKGVNTNTIKNRIKRRKRRKLQNYKRL